MAIIDHLGIAVSDYARSKSFYERVLAPLGITPVMEYGKACGFGRGRKPDFWIAEGPGQQTGAATAITPVHVAFVANSRAEVDAFHRVALEAGGRDNGAPGIREMYHPNYYGAFILDPDGHNVEAVIHVAP